MSARAFSPCLRSQLFLRSSPNPNECTHERSKSARMHIHESQRFRNKADGLYLTTPKNHKGIRHITPPGRKPQQINKKYSLGMMPMHNVGLKVLFSVVALLNLVFSLFFHLMTPLSKEETSHKCSPVQFLWCCDH